MKKILSILFLTKFGLVISQELLLVIDEQFANKTFDYFDDNSWSQANGDLDWIKKSSIEGDNSHIIDLGSGDGSKLEHYMINLDELYIYSRAENAYTNSNGLVIEAVNHGVINDNQSLSGLLLYYPWTFRRGYFEIEAKLAEGQGIVSTWFFFSSRPGMEGMCDGSQISNWQEIDVFETGGAFPNDLRNNIHWSNYLTGTENCNSCVDSHCQNGYDGVNDDADPNFMTNFHNYGLYWDEDLVIFLIDGFIYRYWLKNTPVNKQNGDIELTRFEDAMVSHFTCQYGVQETVETSQYEAPGIFDHPNHLNPPNPEETIAEGNMQINYFRYWIILPCENQADTLYSPLSDYPTLANKEVINYNDNSYGHFEAGKNITCLNSAIEPSVDGAGEEIPYSYPQKLNLYASNSITLENGFHAKASTNNYQVNSNFHAKIQTCANISNLQPMPFIQNIDVNSSVTFKENFYANLSNMISLSYANDSPLKSPTDAPLSEIAYYDNAIAAQIVPNPSSCEIKLHLPCIETVAVQFYNFYGQLVLTIPSYSSGTSIKINELLAGIYLLNIQSENYSSQLKFVKI